MLRARPMRCRDRRIAYTARGRLALVPVVAKVGDMCCIVQGLDYPVIIRPASDETFKFAGDAYVNGVIEGELMGSDSCQTPEWKTI
jgi:hypothetical protein